MIIKIDLQMREWLAFNKIVKKKTKIICNYKSYSQIQLIAFDEIAFPLKQAFLHNNQNIFTSDPHNLQLRHIRSRSPYNFSPIILGSPLINLLLRHKTIYLNSVHTLKYTDCKILRCLFWLEQDEVRYHFRNVDDV